MTHHGIYTVGSGRTTGCSPSSWGITYGRRRKGAVWRQLSRWAIQGIRPFPYPIYHQLLNLPPAIRPVRDCQLHAGSGKLSVST